MNGIKFLKFIFSALFLPAFCFALITLDFSVQFFENQYVSFLNLDNPTFIHSLKVLSCSGSDGMLDIRCGDKLLDAFYCNSPPSEEIILDDTYYGECTVFSYSGNGTIEFQLTGDFETTTTSTLPEFLQNQFLPTLGQILTDIVPLFIMIIGIVIAFILLKGFIEFFKPFFRRK
jgi:hypothetical protein